MSKGMLKPEDFEPNVAPYEYYLTAFKELSSCRINGMSIGPIPFTAIVEYHRIYGYAEEDFEDFHSIIRVMDDTLLEIELSKQKGATKDAANNRHQTHNRKSIR